MRRHRVLAVFHAGVALTLATTPRLEAQGLAGRVALEGIASLSSQARTLDDPMVVLDLVGTIRIGNGWDVVVRPWSMRRPGGDWMFEMYQLQVRYVSSTRVPFRLDAGIIPSPVGLFALELQPHRNPLISAPFYYFVPLPAMNRAFEGVRLMSGGYPVGATFTVSGSRWDARAGVTDSSPAQPRNAFSDSRPPAEPQLVVGGGFVPVTGMRLGAGFTRGRYHSRAVSTSAPVVDPPTATVFNVEGEYAAGHTRVSGEWIRDRFDTAAGPVVSRGFNLQAAHTVTPRIFAATRVTRVSSPVVTIPDDVRRTSMAFEVSMGYRLTTWLTVRGGYQRERSYNEPQWRNAAAMSLVWADRWW